MASLRFSPSRLREARERAHLPRDRAAVAASIASATLEAWERGRAVPDSAKLANLCAVLDISMADLFVADVPEAAVAG